MARQQLSCGMHVHVGLESRAEGVAVLDRIRPWLSVLMALSANSPFAHGVDTGYASYRTVLWGQWPTATVTEAFGDEAGYDRVIAELIASEAALDDGMIYFEARLSASYPTSRSGWPMSVSKWTTRSRSPGWPARWSNRCPPSPGRGSRRAGADRTAARGHLGREPARPERTPGRPGRRVPPCRRGTRVRAMLDWVGEP